ncbi:MAG: class I SAM-dependent methyltransferase [Pseudomonadota bacterium]
MTGGDAATLAFYTSEAEAYAEYTTAEKRSPLVKEFGGMLPAGGAVLDFGCGSGWAARRFREMGFSVLGFDGSAGLAAEAKRRYDIDVTVGRFEEFGDVDAYDGIWASFCLLHDSREALPGHLGRLFAALRPGGRIYIGLKEGEGRHRDSLGRLYTYFTQSEMQRLMEAAGFTGFTARTEPSTGYDGEPATSLHIYASRP